MTSMWHRYVASTSVRRHMPAGNLAPLAPPISIPCPPPHPTPQYSKPSYAYAQNGSSAVMVDIPLAKARTSIIYACGLLLRTGGWTMLYLSLKLPVFSLNNCNKSNVAWKVEEFSTSKTSLPETSQLVYFSDFSLDCFVQSTVNLTKS